MNTSTPLLARRAGLAAALWAAALAPALWAPAAQAVASAPASSASASAPAPSAAPAATPAREAAGRKVLRYAFPVAETGFDPARIVDLYSRIVTAHIFESLYTYDHLARPVKFRPVIAEGMPEHSEDFRTWTVKIRPGIFFQDDPAFGGKPREVTAQDFVYAYKRFADPANKSPVVAGVLDQKYLGLAALRERALKEKKPFDYDTEIEGIRALDRHTIQFRLEEPRPRFIENLAAHDLFGAVAREVVEKYGDAIPAHPVGTGPFRLAQWRRSSLIALERNPTYREVRYDAEPAADDAQGQAILARMKGRRLPMIDRVEISIIEESQPRWLAFLNREIDFLNVPAEFVNQAMPNGRVAPNLTRQGIQGYRALNPDSAFTYFNMDDPVVGGYTPARVALRRAIALAMDVEREIRVIRRSQAVPAQSMIVPHTTGYDAAFKSENGDYDPARAKALLDLHGYVDRNGDGWREQPDGKPLVLEVATQPDQLSRQFDELWKKNMERIGIRVKFFSGKWPEQLKAARAGKLMLWTLGSSAAGADGQSALARLYGPQAGSQNLARFKNAEFDRIYQRMQIIPDGPEREELFRQAKLIATAYMPYKTTVHRFTNDIVHPWLAGYRRPLFWQEWWHMVDIDDSRRPAK
ncbi:MAG: ABC transporter substrate-binding protein [Rubrivivax sp.]